MKRSNIVFSTSSILFFSSVLFTACGNKTDGNLSTLDTTLYELAQEEGPGHDDPRTLPAVNVDFGGKHYVTTVSISPSDSLPMVKDSYDDPYKDNEAKVKVTVDGAVLIDKVWGKVDFLSAVGSDVDLKNQIFCGIAFDKISNNGIVFRAQLAAPGDVEGGTSFYVIYPLDGSTPVIERDNNRETEALPAD